VLSFIGAVHWGFALRDVAHPVNGQPLAPAVLGAERQLLAFGVVPALIGWVALLAMIHFNAPGLSIFLLLLGFFATIVVETIGKGKGIVANNYLALALGGFNRGADNAAGRAVRRAIGDADRLTGETGKADATARLDSLHGVARIFNGDCYGMRVDRAANDNNMLGFNVGRHRGVGVDPLNGVGDRCDAAGAIHILDEKT